MRIMIVIISKALDIIRWGGVIKKEATLVQIISDNGNVSFRCVN
jgi:hypothetical protein